MAFEFHAPGEKEDNGSNLFQRKLSYRFYPHFHPFVTKLIERLIQGSVGSLQATDTDYAGNPDGTWKPLPYSTLAALAADTQVILSGGDKSTVVIGTPLIITNGTIVRLPSGKLAPLPGDLVLTEPRGLRLTVPGGKETIAFGTKVRLVSDAEVTLTNGSQATLSANTELAVTSCKPQPKLYAGIFSATQYHPSDLVRQPYPVRELDFTFSGAYAVYNWELFYHVPITVAIHLSKNQRFEQAMRWFHYVFDPTDDSDGPTPERFWKVKPFQTTDVKLIEEILVNLSSGVDSELQQATIKSIVAWKDSPFRPHLVARYRQSPYMFKTVMAYLDNLIAWGDSLFRQDTGESINEAQQLYILGANILGARPQAVPKKGVVQPKTYANLRAHLDKLGNAQVEFEPDIVFDIAPHPGAAADTDQFDTLGSMADALYFCIPRNDNLLSYWDTVADRLFKIRNSLNIQGIFRQLPLFEPPIDPALLAKAAAAGLDVGAIISGLNQPLPLVRFQFLVQKAAEICQEVKSLGNNLLTAIEKEDNEALAMLRARHESVVLKLAETVKYVQWQEAIKTRESLEKSVANAVERFVYYEKLLGKKEGDITVPGIDALDIASLEKANFKSTEPEVELPDIPVDIAADLSGEGGGKKMNTQEVEEMRKLKEARGKHDSAAIADTIGAALGLIPTFGARFEPFGAGGTIGFGGSNLASRATLESNSLKANADKLAYEANRAFKIASYANRERDYAFQSNLAAGEINQIFKQIRAAQIREAIAEREWKNHQQQIRHADDIEHFLSGEKNSSGHKKTSTQAFYAWMKREAKGLYGQVFQFAFDIAKKAERALQHELGNPELSFLQFGYLAGKDGLFAGEKLYLDIKRMEMAYHDLNKREYELTKHVSVLQVNPLSLLELRATGRCTLSLPEELFDMDGPGHYFRRIKSVAVSIPCVTGPYTSVNCTLTLLKSSIRKSPLLAEAYARTDAEDIRFSDHFGSMQAIVTSSGQNDSGMFETNLRDERMLPFEWSGVISEWQLQLAADPGKDEPCQFDYDTITDVILHLRYTAREAGVLRNGAIDNLRTRIEEAQAAGSVRLFSVRHEFPTEWAKFKSVGAAAPFAELTLNFREEHYPFWSKGIPNKAVKRVDLYAKAKSSVNVFGKLTSNSQLDQTTMQTLSAPLGNLRTAKLDLNKIILAEPTDTLTLFFENNAMDNLWVSLAWGIE